MKPTTIDDVARAANVSSATVSRALRGHGNVNEATRKRIEEVARQLDYRPNASASRLASRTSSGVALVVPVLDSWYFSSVMAGVEAVLTAAGFELVIFVSGDEKARHRLMSSSLPRGAGGVILVDVALQRSDLDDLVRQDAPVVSVGLEFEGMSSVVVDDVKVGIDATQHLLDLGHTDIGLIAGKPNDPYGFDVSRQRRNGYLQAIDHAGLTFRPEWERGGDFTVSGGYRAMNELLDLACRPTAVFSMSDEMAFGALRALRERGLQVPTDMSVVGVDDHPLAWVEELTTVRQSIKNHGETAAHIVLERMASDDPDGHRRVGLEATLVERRSTAPLPNGVPR